MNRKRRKLLSELKDIAAHFRMTVSKIEVFRKTAFALDTTNKKLLVLNDEDKPYFKTIDLQQLEACAVKVDYGQIDAGDLQNTHIDEFIQNVQLHLSHSEPQKSVSITFYNARHNSQQELRQLLDKVNSWREKIAATASGRLLAAASI